MDTSNVLEGESVLPFHPGLSSVGQDIQRQLTHPGGIEAHRRKRMQSYVDGVTRNLVDMAHNMEQQHEILSEMASCLRVIGQQHTLMLDLLTELEEEFESCF